MSKNNVKLVKFQGENYILTENQQLVKVKTPLALPQSSSPAPKNLSSTVVINNPSSDKLPPTGNSKLDGTASDVIPPSSNNPNDACSLNGKQNILLNILKDFNFAAIKNPNTAAEPAPKAESSTATTTKGKKTSKKEGASPANSCGEWSDEQTYELIVQYRDKPCLYDLEDPTYKNRKLKMEAYQDILAVLRRRRPSTTAKQLKAKINSLRTSFAMAYKQESKTPSGAGADQVYKPSMQFYDDLSFLKRSICNKKGSTNLDLVKQGPGTAECDDDDDDDALNDLINADEQHDHDQIPEIPIKKRKKDTKETVEGQIVNVMGTMNSTLQAIANRKKEVQVAPAPAKPTEKPYEAFCAFVGERLQSFSPKKALKLQNKIMQALCSFPDEN